MKRNHPFTILAPYFALGAFALTVAQSWTRHTDPLLIVLRGVLAFYATFYLVRFCASFLGAAEPSPTGPAENVDPAPGPE